MLFSKIEPNPEIIIRILQNHGICPDISNSYGLDVGGVCHEQNHRKLDAVIPLHGHYDHAMDSAFIAGWTGAPTLSNPSLDNLFRATETFASDRGYSFHGSVEENISLSKHLEPNSPPIRFADMSVILFRNPHSENLISSNLASETKTGFKFPATIWRMGEGDSLGALVRHGDQRILFMGSAGNIGDRLAGYQAQAVYLSVGGLGLMSKDERTDYWHDVVIQTGAKRVFLTHWDNHQNPLPGPGGALRPTWFEPHDKVLAHLQALAGKKIEITFPATRVAVNPVHELAK